MPKGRILQLNDGRYAIEYQNQPLLNQGKLIWYLIDKHLKPIKDEEGKQLILVRVLGDTIRDAKVIGHID